MAITNDQSLVLKIVAGLFNAAPGKANFDALASMLTSGSTPLQIAEALDSVPAFTSTALGSATTAQAKVDALMNNFGLSVAGDLNPNSAASQAFSYFTSAVAAGQSLGKIVNDAVVFLSGSVPAAFADTAKLLGNKAAVAEYYSVTKGLSASSMADLQKVISKVTASSDVSTPAALDTAIGQATDSVAPVATAATFSFAENAKADTTLGTVKATDNSGVTGFEIVSGNDSKFFAIDAAGKVTLTTAGLTSAANDFEVAPNSFTLGVKASDAAGNKSETVNVVLNITDVDDVAPAFVGATAATGSNKVTVNFGEALKAGNPATTAFTVKDGSSVVGVTAAAVNNNAVTLTLASNVTGAVTVGYDSATASNKLQDAAGNIVANFDGKTASSDVTAPTLSSSTPADNGTLGKADNIVLTFSEDVVLGSSGNITITNSGDSKDTRTIAVNDSAQISVSGTKVTINPTADLAESGAYYINIPGGVISDKAGNTYAGISDATTLNFSTTATTPSTTGQTFTLTTGSDNIVGTANNDIISGFSSAIAGTSTFSAADVIKGGLGVDTFNLVTDTAVTPVFASTLFSEIEKVNVTALGFAPTLTMTGITGLTDISSSGSTVATAFTGVGNIVASAITNATAANYSLTYADAALNGSADAQKLTLSSVGSSATPIATTFARATAATNELESLDITSNTAANFITLTTNGTQTSLKTITIDGSASLTMGLAADNITTSATVINAGAATGNVQIGNATTTLGNANHSVTLGSGSDSVFFGANLNGSDTVVGGNGIDIVQVTTALTAAQVANVSGVEKIRIDAGAGVTQDVSLLTNITAYQLAGAQTFAMSNITSTNNNMEIVAAVTTLTPSLKDGSGLNDTLNLTVGTSTAGFTLSTLSNVSGLETLNIVSQGAANTISTNSVTAKNVVTGAANLTTTISATAFDSTAATGVMTVTTSNTATNLQLGSGADIITLGTGADTVSAGAGNDTINIGSTGIITAGADVLSGGAGNDTYKYTATQGATAASTSYAAFGTISDFKVGTSTSDSDFLAFSGTDANFGSTNATPTASTGLAKGNTAAALAASDAMVVQTVAQNAAAAAAATNVSFIKLTTGVAFTTDIAATAAAAIGSASVTGLAANGTYLVSFYDTTNSKMVVVTANTGTNAAANTALASNDFSNANSEAHVHVVGVVNMTAADYANFGATNLAAAF